MLRHRRAAVVGMVASLVCAQFAFAHSELTQPEASGELRLIETAQGRRAWMTQDEITELMRRSHEEGHCGGFMDVTDHPEKRPVFHKILGVFENREPRHQALVEKLLPQLSAEKVMANVAKLSSYNNRFLRTDTGVAAAEWIRDEFKRLSHGRSDVSVRLVRHRFIQPSVIATIAGRGPKAKEHVVIGAHEDSINWGTGWPNPKDRAPGADDNASGTSTVLETFRVLMESGYQPERTLEFMAYAGEEVGLLGSQDIAEQYKKDGVQVVGVLQLDMTMYPSADGRIHMINDNTDRSMNQFVEMLIDTYVKVPWTEMACGYGCSDHASWDAAGYPAAFPFEASMGDDNPNIHTAKDTMDPLSASWGMHFVKLATAFAVEMASE